MKRNKPADGIGGFDVAEYYQRAIAIALHMGCRDRAEEFANEAAFHLYLNAHKFRGNSKFSTWAHRVIWNCIGMQLRVLKRQEEREVSLEACCPSVSEEESTKPYSQSTLLKSEYPQPDELLSYKQKLQLVDGLLKDWKTCGISKPKFLKLVASEAPLKESQKELGVSRGVMSGHKNRMRTFLKKAIKETGGFSEDENIPYAENS